HHPAHPRRPRRDLRLLGYRPGDPRSDRRRDPLDRAVRGVARGDRRAAVAARETPLLESLNARGRTDLDRLRRSRAHASGALTGLEPGIDLDRDARRIRDHRRGTAEQKLALDALLGELRAERADVLDADARMIEHTAAGRRRGSLGAAELESGARNGRNGSFALAARA